MQRRRIKVIDNVFQYRMVAVLLLVVLGGLAAFSAGAVLLFALAGLSAQRLVSLYPPILLNDIVIMLFLIGAGVFLTHRIAGPVFRVLSDIDKALAGEKHVRVRFRRRDAFPELARKVNQLLERLDEAPRR